jgi:hypothetical protein
MNPMDKANKILKNSKDAKDLVRMMANELGWQKFEEIVDVIDMSRNIEERRVQIKMKQAGIFTEGR